MASREALETVAAHDEGVLDAPVAELGQQAHPELGALPAGGSHPQTQHVAFAVQVDAHGHVDGPVGDLAVADLHHDGVDQQHRVDAVQGPVLPRQQVLDDGVGDPADGVPGDLGAVDLGQMRLDVAGGHALGVQRDHVPGQAVQAALTLAHRHRREARVAVPGDPQPDLGRPRWSRSWGSGRCGCCPTPGPRRRGVRSPGGRSSRPPGPSAAPGAPKRSTARRRRSARHPRCGPARPVRPPSPASPAHRPPATRYDPTNSAPAPTPGPTEQNQKKSVVTVVILSGPRHSVADPRITPGYTRRRTVRDWATHAQPARQHLDRKIIRAEHRVAGLEDYGRFRQRWLAEHPEAARRIQHTQRELRGLGDSIGVEHEERLEAVLERGLKSPTRGVENADIARIRRQLDRLQQGREIERPGLRSDRSWRPLVQRADRPSGGRGKCTPWTPGTAIRLEELSGASRTTWHPELALWGRAPLGRMRRSATPPRRRADAEPSCAARSARPDHRLWSAPVRWSTDARSPFEGRVLRVSLRRRFDKGGREVWGVPRDCGLPLTLTIAGCARSRSRSRRYVIVVPVVIQMAASRWTPSCGVGGAVGDGLERGGLLRPRLSTTVALRGARW